MPNALKKGHIAARVGEALANYELSDAPLAKAADLKRSRRAADGQRTFMKDEEFWSGLLQTRGEAERPRSFWIYDVAVSEWVARIPGLYWLPGSAQMREVHPSQIESEIAGWRTYSPKGKSQQVSGGIGTLRFPPSDDGYRLVTLTASYNASTGVPALVSPEVWDHLELREGSFIRSGEADWRPMPQRWAVQFPVVQEIPRGCLVLNDLSAIRDVEHGVPIQIHPFSVMEYWDGETQLYDFVYATADTRRKRFRDELSNFFEKYRKAKDREGSYLIAADISEPMWDATFANPEEMRRDREAQLRLIEKRVEDTVNGTDVVEGLVRQLTRVAGVTDLQRLSVKAGIEYQRWSRGGAIVDEAARLVDAAIRFSRLQALLYAVQLEVPQ